MKHMVLIDGMGFVFRAYHGVRSSLTRSDGLPTNALFGFAQMLIKVVDDLRPDFCAVVLDSKPPNWRHGLYAEYKANRPPPDEALVRQLEFIEPLIAAFGLPMLRLAGFEADDILATLVAKAKALGEPAKITVVTSDKDLLQLVSEGLNNPSGVEVKLLDTLSDTWRGVAASFDKFGVPPEQVLDVQALMGDASDNIPGAPGVGPKTAAELINQFGSVDGVYARLAEVKRDKLRLVLAENEDKVRLSRQLASLKDNVPLPEVDMAFQPKLHEAAGYLRDVLEFRSLAARLEKREKHVEFKPIVQVSTQDNVSEILMAGPVPVQAVAQNTFGAGWGTYECVTTLERWQHWVKRIEQARLVAWDTETTNLHVHEADIVGISLAVAAGEACYVPLGHTLAESADSGLFGGGLLAGQLPARLVLEQLAAWMAAGQIKMVAHNLKYDLLVLARALGVLGHYEELVKLVVAAEDTMLASACLDGGRWGHGLDSLVLRHLNHTMIAFKEVCGSGKSAITFDKVPLDKATAYAAEDADATWQLWQTLAPRLHDEKPKYGVASIYALEKKVLPVVALMEANGVRVDLPFLRELSNGWAQELAVLEATIHTAAGRTFNVASPAQLAQVMFEELKLGTSKQQAAGGTGIDVLESLLEETPPEHAGYTLVQAVMEYRQLAKLRSTYTEALLKEVNTKTGRVHTSYMQIGASTGRFSSSDPNLQNIPIRTEQGRKVRQAFVPRAGWQMLSADYSQIELRLLAHFSGSVALRQAFTDGLDIHAYTASLVAGVPLASISKEQRRAAKFVNFGLVYGMGARSLASQIGCSVAEAQEWIAAYFKRYEGVKEYMEANKQTAREKGYVETLLGRRIWLPEIMSNHGGLRSGAERAAINAPLQGSNADVIKLAMPQVQALAEKHGATLLMQVHDELVLEAAPEIVDTLKAELPRVMANVVSLSVPLVAEVGVGGNWDSAH
jgi:DNA polymerase I